MVTLTPEQTARTIYYLKVARQRLAAQLMDAEHSAPALRLEYGRVDELVRLFDQHLEEIR